MTATLHDTMMQRALALAAEAGERGDVPVGAVVYDAEGKIWGEGANRVVADTDPTAHAEILALRAAAKAKGAANLEGLHLAVTLEPCAMCAQAMAWARIAEVRFGAWDPKSGGTVHGARVFQSPTCHHKPVVYDGWREEECRLVLQRFFSVRR